MISFETEVCRDLGASIRREWLETNGLGGYASSTISGMNTRRYHALLTAAVRPPTERVVLLSKLEETLVVDGERFELATNQYPQSVHPQGYQFQTGFRLDPFPTLTFRAAQVGLEKSVFMLHGENTTVVRYRLQAPAHVRATLEVRPLVAFRDYHSLLRAAGEAPIPLEIENGLLRVAPRGTGHSLFLAHDAARTLIEGVWYKQFEYAEEKARGFDYHEDLFNPCVLVFELRGDAATCSVIASTERRDARQADAFERRVRESRRQVTGGATTHDNDEFVQTLRAAADQFIVRRGQDLHTVIAGYHWFTDWGRDTMISLPGLALATGRFDIARQILLAFAEHLSEGLIPNRFPDAGDEPEYNTVDGTLWFVQAAGELLRRTGDEQFVRENLYGRLKEILNWHERGTRYDIRVTQDGLLRAGQQGVQLTWMDAKVGDYVVTPRTGKPVEIQALWYNALRTVEEMAGRFGDDLTRSHCRLMAEHARDSFDEYFWNEAARCLYDFIADDGAPDPAVRPNQIFAISLPHPILTGERALRVVEAVERELLTPYGLRSLSPHHKDYRARYEGDALARDSAYHQGTVWAWLIGPFITAYLKVHERTPESIDTARRWLQGFREHLSDAGLGQISEIFDGDTPHTPRGCIAQAWSVAEVLRCEIEELEPVSKPATEAQRHREK